MNPLARRPVGQTGLEVSVLGFGSAPLGGFRGAIPEDNAQATIRNAYDGGLTLFDTSPYYGYGRSEHRCGHFLRQRPRHSYVLSTKVGRWLKPLRQDEPTDDLRPGGMPFRPVFDYSYDGAMRSYEQSLLRLGTGSVDILLIHDVDIFTHGSAEAASRRFDDAMEGAYPALDELRRNGDIRAIGVGLNETEWCQRFLEAADIDCMLLAGRYTLLEQGALDELLPACEAKQVSVILGGPYNSGILASGSVAGAKYDYADAPPDILARVAHIQDVCGRHGVPVQAAALQFPLAHPAICAVIPGAMRPEEVTQNIAFMGMPIPGALWDDLRAEGLINPSASTPPAPSA